jgi:hypothetical protein
MLASIQHMPDFKTAEDRQTFFKENADYFTATCRTQRFKHRSEHKTLDDARTAAAIICRTMQRAALIYGVIGSSSEWLENVHPTT